MSYFADQLKQLRIQRGLTQAALSKELNVTQNAIFNWENGKREPSIEMIQKIADYFQVSTAYLFAEKETYRTILKFLDECSKGKAPDAIDYPQANRGNSMEDVPKAAEGLRSDFVVTDEAGTPLMSIAFMESNKSYEHLISYIQKCYEWYQKTYKSLNEDGQRKVAEYAELLSQTEKYQKKSDESVTDPSPTAERRKL